MRFDEAALEDPRSIRPVVDTLARWIAPRWSSSPTCPCTSCRPTQPSTLSLAAADWWRPPPSAIKAP